MVVRISMSWKTFSSRVASRPATTITSIIESQPAIHSAAIGLEGAGCVTGLPERFQGGQDGMPPLWPPCNAQIARPRRDAGLKFGMGAGGRSVLMGLREAQGGKQ